ncbi:MAG: hypothetical protein ACPGXZ_06625 [Saprospiraceae bacterium]
MLKQSNITFTGAKDRHYYPERSAKDVFGAIWDKMMIRMKQRPNFAAVQNNRLRSMGMLGLIMSQANRNASIWDTDTLQILDSDGKYRMMGAKINVALSPEFKNRTRPDSYTELLNENVVQGPTIIDQKGMLYHRSPGLKIDYALLRGIAENASEIFPMRIEEHIANFESEIAAMITAHIVEEHMGARPALNLVDNTAESYEGFKDLALFNDEGTAINPIGEIEFRSDMEQAGLVNDYLKVGGAMVNVYRQLNNITGLAEIGINAGLQAIIDDYVYDKQLAGAVKRLFPGVKNPLMAIAPGFIQLIAYSRYKGDFLIDEADHKRTTVYTPTFGIPVTMVYNYKYSGQDKVQEIWYEWNGRCISPADVEWTTDPKYRKVNGVMGFSIVSQDRNVNDLDIERTTPMNTTYEKVEAPNNYQNGTTPFIPIVSYVKDELEFAFDSSMTYPINGQEVAEYKYEFGGVALSIPFGAAGDTITGITGVSGTYEKPVIDVDELDGATSVTMTAKDDAGNEKSKVVSL